MRRLLARVSEDGYLFACTDDFVNGYNESYWYDSICEGTKELEIETIEITVPNKMVKDLLAHGTSDQVYSDGYEAWQDVLDAMEVK